MFVIKINNMYVHKNHFHIGAISLTDKFEKAKTYINGYWAEQRVREYISYYHLMSSKGMKYMTRGKNSIEIIPDNIKIHELNIHFEEIV